MDTAESIVVVLGGIVAIIVAIVGLWLKVRTRPKAKESPPSVQHSGEGDINVSSGGKQTAGDQGVQTQADQIGTLNVYGAADPETKETLKTLDERSQRADEMLKDLTERMSAPGASTPNTDALAAETTPDVEKLLAEAIALQKNHKEREAIEKLLTAYDSNLPDKAKADLHLLAGNGYHRLADYPAAESQYKQSLQAADTAGQRHENAGAISGLGLVYRHRGDLDKAEDHHKKALAVHLKTGDRLGQANQLGNLGLVYEIRGDLDEAEDHHKKALGINQEIGNRLGQANQLCNLGNVYKNHGKLDAAEEHYAKALAIHQRIGDRFGQAHDLGNLGNIYRRRGDLDTAEEYHTKALAIDEDIDNRLGQAEDLGNLGVVHSARGNLDVAQEHFKQALPIFEEIGAGPEMEKTRRLIEKLSSASGSPEPDAPEPPE